MTVQYRVVAFQPVLLAILLAAPLAAWSAKTPQVEANHMRWENSDAVLGHTVAWQEERDGHWVTVVLITDRPVPRDALARGRMPGELMERAAAQGVAFAIMSGGVPLPQYAFEIGYRDGNRGRTTTMNGAGGFEIDVQSATRIKGRAVFSPFTAGARDKSAWSLNFDAPVLLGDAKRMAAEGEALGPGGGQPWKDLMVAQQAMLAMDYTTLAAYAAPDLAASLQDAGKRERNLRMLKSMTSPQAKFLGGLQKGATARVYWLQQWPAALDNRCVDTMALKDGKWRSIEAACQAE